MNIILEGPDGTGKSTFAKRLMTQMPRDWTYQSGMGPPKYPGEMSARIIDQLKRDKVVFDRHPCISEPIYGRFRPVPEVISMTLIEHFYDMDNFIVYFYQTMEHKENEHDTAEHLGLLHHHGKRIIELYEEWAEQTGVLRFDAINDSTEALIEMCKEKINENR